MAWINTEIADRQPRTLTIAEDIYDNPMITEAAGSSSLGFGAQLGFG